MTADARHRAIVAAHDGHKGFAWALNLEADRLAARLRKVVGK